MYDPSGNFAFFVVTTLDLAGITVMGVRISKSGEYRIDRHYPNDHVPTHVHIIGDDGRPELILMEILSKVIDLWLLVKERRFED